MDTGTSVTEGRDASLVCRKTIRLHSADVGFALTAVLRTNSSLPVSSLGTVAASRYGELDLPAGAARRPGALAEGTVGVGLVKGQVNCAAAHPTGGRLAP